MYLIQKRKYSYGNKNILANLCSTDLANNLGAKIVTPQIKPKNKNDLFINWGLSSIPWLTEDISILNEPKSVKLAIDKVQTALLFREKGIPFPPFCLNLETASSLFTRDKDRVFCRTLSKSFQGRGIIVATKPSELVLAPLYTKYIKKVYEFRVHAFHSSVIHLQQKKRLSREHLEELGLNPNGSLIRNYSNGYRFSSNISGISDETLKVIGEVGVGAIRALNLDFGAVDIIVTKDGEVYTLEVNTAPGIDEVSMGQYVKAFSNVEY